MRPITLKFLKASNNAILPKKNYPTDACFDLYYPLNKEPLFISSHEQVLVDTELSCIIPEHCWIKFHERSGLAYRKGIKVSAGVIDQAYTGRLKVLLLNTSDTAQIIDSGTAICQFSIEEVRPCEIAEINLDDFKNEESVRSRKAKGFGSSGV
jgi:dUTP pyrophosphatase